MMTRIRPALLALALAGAGPLAAQQPAPATAPAATAAPAPNPADVASVDAIVRALYDVISGDSGVARNWDRFRSLFAPGAQLMPVFQRQGQAPQMLVWTPEEYLRRNGPALERNGFHEREIARRQESYGQIVHAFSTYESRRRAGDAQPFARGINSIQLWTDGSRWWVQTIMWWGETPATPIPQRNLASEIH